MESISPTQLHKVMNKTTRQTIRTIKDTKVEDTSTGMKINVEVMEVKVDSLGIETTDQADPSNVLHVIRRDIGMQTIHIKIEMNSNFVLIVE